MKRRLAGCVALCRYQTATRETTTRIRPDTQNRTYLLYQIPRWARHSQQCPCSRRTVITSRPSAPAVP